MASVAVPVSVVTETLKAPSTFEGEIAVIWVGLSTVTVVDGAVPKRTIGVPVKLVPVMTTLVPPDDGPALGETWLMVGAPA